MRLWFTSCSAWNLSVIFYWTRDSNRPALKRTEDPYERVLSTFKCAIRLDTWPFWCWCYRHYNLNTFENKQLIEASCSHDERQIHKFWFYIVRFLDLCWKGTNAAVKFLVVFSTTFSREKGFSSLTYLKSKYRNKLNVYDALRLYYTKLEPDID